MKTTLSNFTVKSKRGFLQALALLVLVSVGILSQPALAQTTPQAPCTLADIDQDDDGLIEICNLEGLNAIRHQLDGSGYKASRSATKITAGCAEGGCKGYELSKDLDFNNEASYSSTPNKVIWTTGSGWEPIGYYKYYYIVINDKPFKAIFEGNGYTISNLMINRPFTTYKNRVGLFGYIEGGTIKNVGLSSVKIFAANYVGGLVGYNWKSSITNSYATGVVAGWGNYVGGLVSFSYRGTITNSYATGSVTSSGGGRVGGLVGYSSSDITNSYATGSVKGHNYVGGLVGRNGGTITNSYATGSVEGDRWVGGLVGSRYSGTIRSSYWDKTTSRMSSSSGGVGKTTTELQSPITSTGIYSSWSTNDWDFGTNEQYPALKYRDGTLIPNQGREIPEEPVQIPQIEIAGVPASAVNEGERITLTASSTSSASSVPLIYQWQQTSGETLLTNPTSGSSVILDVPEDYVAAGENTGNVVLILEASSDVGSSTQQVSITIAKHDNGGIVALGVPTLNERELTAPSIDLSGDPDGVGSTIGYQWQSRQSTQTAWVNVPAAGTNERYTIPADITGIVEYRVVVSYTDGQGYGEEVVSEAVIYERIIVPQPSIDIASLTSCGTADIDRDNDGLIEICDLEGLNAIRHQLDGSGYRASRSATKITTGCAESGCRGYELSKDLDFNDDDSYSSTSNKVIWTTGSGWEPIGVRNSGFEGAFDGNGYTISNLMVNRLTVHYIGLFGYTKAGARIVNVGLLNLDIVGRNNVGGLIGRNSGSVLDSYVAGSVKGSNNVGGLVGYSYRGGTIMTSYATGNIEGNWWVGGLVGDNWSSITNSYAAGAVSGNRHVGGLVGWYSEGSITNSYATGSVSGNRWVGGLVGSRYSGTIRSSYWDKTTSRISSSAGGVGKTTTELQSPIGATGIYSSWSISSWDFGTREQYPALKYSDGTLIPNQVRERPEEPAQEPQIEIAGVPEGAVDEGGSITLTASSTSSASSNPLIYQWQQTLGKTLLTSPTSGSSVTLNVPEDHVVESANTSNLVLTLEANNNIIEQIAITITKRNNGGIAALGVPNLNERELTASSIDLSGDPDGVGSTIGYQWQIRQSTQTAWINVQTAGTNALYTIPAGITGIVQYRVVMSYTDGQGYGEEVVSEAVIYERRVAPQPSIDIASLTSCGTADIDQDDDGLIEICDLEGLNAMRYQLNGSGYRASWSATKITAGCAESGCRGYELSKDLDFNDEASYSSTPNKVIWTTGSGWEPIGVRNSDFESTFDGNGYTISNLMVNRATVNGIGLFGHTKAGTEIANIGLLDVDIQGDYYVGGLVGFNKYSSITNSYATGNVEGEDVVGGLVGFNNYSSITNSYVTGSVKGDDYVGGLVGNVDGPSSITNSYVTGSVKGDGYVGGLVGENSGSITNSYATGNVEGDNNVGGLVGVGYGNSITNSYATGSVTGSSYVGGLVGSHYSGTITKSYWDKTTSRILSGNDGVGKTTTELQSPTGATGIYSSWSTSSWDFGTREQYPALKYSDGTLMPNQVRERPEEPAQEPQIEIAGMPTGAVNEGESITLTASSTSSASSIPLIYQWQQTLGKTLLISSTSGSRVTLDVPEDYVVASDNTGNVVLTLEVSNDVGSTIYQVSITIAKRNNGGIAALGVPSLNERELTAPSIDLSGDPDGSGGNIRYQWQSRQSAQTEWVNVQMAGINERYTIPADTAGIVQYRVVVSYTDGQGYGEEIESEASIYEGNTIPSVEIAGVPVGAVDEGEQITLTAFPNNSENNILPSYSWTQTLGKTLLTSPTSGSSVTLDVPEDYVAASENAGNAVLMLEASNDVGSTTQQVSITIAKSNNGGIAALGVPSLNERELTAPSIDLSGDPDGGGNNIGYQWQSRQSTKTAWVNVQTAGTNERYIIPADTAGVVEYRVVVSYTDGQGYAEQVESGTSSYKGNTIPSIEIVGVPADAVDEGEQITLTAFPHNSDNNILPSYSWTQISGKTLLISPTSGSSVTLDVPEDYVAASENTGNVELILEESNDVGSTTQQVSITIAKSNNGGIAALDVPSLNERELTAPSIDLSGDPDGSGNNIRYQWQIRESTQTAWVNVLATGTNERYTIPVADTAGVVEYHVVVSYTDGQGYREEVVSGAVVYETSIEITDLTFCSTADIDQDDDGLIEICDLEGLDAMRYQLDGSGYKVSASATKITAGCAENGCKGYELSKDLDFDNDASYSNAANKVTWTTGSGWQPIGTSSNPFNATFRANKYSISNLMIARSSLNAVGLFGKTGSQARIEGVGLIDADIQGYDNVGGLVGYNNGGTITNSYITGIVRGDDSIGGLVGYNNGGTITNSYITGIVRGEDSVGGLVGDNYGPITNSYTNVEMSGDSWVGGIVGCNFSGGTVTNSYTVPRINRRSSSSGGLLGYNNSSNGRPVNSYWDKEVSKISSGNYGVGLTTEELQSSMTTTGIYSSWSTNNWDFGTREQYPALKYSDGTLMLNQVREIPEELLQIEIAGVPAAVAVNEGKRITLTGSYTSSASSIPLIYQWQQTSGKTLLTSPTSGSSVTLDVPKDYVVASENIGNVVLILEASNDVESTAQQVLITITKRNNDGIAALGVPSLNERELTAPSIDLSSDPDGSGSNIRYRWQIRQSLQPWVNVQRAGTNALYTIPADIAGIVEYRVVVSYIDGQGYEEEAISGAMIYETGIEIASLTSCSTADIDQDDDGLIEICDLEGLNTIRYQLDGSGYRVTWSATKITAGCAEGGCKGYELNKNLDFDDDASYSNVAKKVRWTTGLGWESIGRYSAGFKSTFEGNDYTISNLMVNRLINYVGLFAVTMSGAKIINVGLLDVDIQGRNYVGGLVGFNRDQGSRITNSYVTGSVKGNSSVGGLVGYNEGFDITNSYATSSVKGDWNVGGLVGFNPKGTITNSYATGAVEGSGSVGGLVGRKSSSGAYIITNSYATGSVKGYSQVGGLVGVGDGITNSYAMGAVEGDLYVGGLVGYVSYYGYHGIKDSYATGSVKGKRMVGGLAGHIYNYSGFHSDDAITKSYWDKTASRMSSSAGGVGKTTTELQSPIGATGIYSSWSTSSWDFGTREQYPALKYRNGTLMPNQVRERPEEPVQVPQIEIANVSTSAVNEGERITLTGSYTSSASSIPLIYQWTQTSGKTLLPNPTSGSSVTLDVPEDYVMESENTGTVVLILEANNNIIEQIIITIAKRNNGGILSLSVPAINERELTAPPIDLSGDPDGSGSNIRYQWQIRQSTQTAWVNVSAAGTNERYTIPVVTAGIVQYRVVVSYTDRQGYEEEVSSGVVIYETSIEIADLTSCGTADIDQDDDGLIEICNLEGLNAMRYQLDGSGYKVSASATKINVGCAEGGCKGYELEKDLDFNDDDSYSSTSNKVIWTTGEGWLPIGIIDMDSLSCEFKGNNHTISNLMINTPLSAYVGLFFMTDEEAIIDGVNLHKVDIVGRREVGSLVSVNERGTIRNIQLHGVSIQADGSEVGGLVGMNEEGTIRNIQLHGVSIQADGSQVGGLVGMSTEDSEIDNVDLDRVSIQVDGWQVGGLVGMNAEGSVIDNVDLDRVSIQADGSEVGGLVGMNEEGTIRNIQLHGVSIQVDGWQVGGLVGMNEEGIIINSRVSGDSYAITNWIEGEGNRIGGLVGENEGGRIINSYAVVNIQGRETGRMIGYHAGGLVGYNTGQIINSYADGSVVADENVGGLIGKHEAGEIINSYATGSVEGERYVGGLVGLFGYNRRGDITNSYAAGSVTGSSYVGGLVGYNRGNSITNSYWDKTTSGRSRSAGGVGKTTTKLQSPITPGSTSTEIYYNWSTNDWDFGTSVQYPALKYSDGTLMPNQRRQIEIAGMPTGAVNEGESITMTASSTSSASSIPLIYQWKQTSGKTLLISPTSGNTVILDVPEDYVAASENTGNVVLILEASNDVGSTTQQISITIAKRNNGGIAALSIPNLNERELTAPSIDSSGDPDGGGNNIGYQWQSRQSTRMAWVDVPVAGTNERYTIPADTAGIVQYRVVMSYTDGQGYGEEVMSVAVSYEGIASSIVCSTADIDQDDDGLIEICDLEGLSAIRHQLDGSGYKASSSATKITAGCAGDGCKGYELIKDLDFNDYDSYSSTSNKVIWTTGAGWEPIGYYRISTDNEPFTATFKGNGHNISNLMIDRSDARGVGLFGYTKAGARIVNVGLLNLDIVGSNNVGGLIGRNSGSILDSYVAGSVKGDSDVGGLVGYSDNGDIANSYVTGSVKGDWDVGGLVGHTLDSSITNSDVAGVVEGRIYVGGLVGKNTYTSITRSYVIGSVKGDNYVGGLVGYNRSSITNSYAKAFVKGYDYVGGLAGYNRSSITNSYATGSVKGDNYVGGLAGDNGNSSITNSYWDKTASRISSSTGGVGKTATELQSPTGATGIYSRWSTNVWDFGTSEQYPALKYRSGTLMPNQRLMQIEIASLTSCGTVDIDQDDDGLIEICNLEGLNAIRHQPDGSGYRVSVSTIKITAGCAEGGCKGYELNKDLDFNDYDSYSSTPNKVIWTTGSGWQPIGTFDYPFDAMFRANKYSISNLMIARSSFNRVGLFGNIGSQARIEGVSLIDADVRGHWKVGGLAGGNHGGTITNSYSTGSVTGSSYVGGLVGYSYNGDIANSYATSSAKGNNNVGGLVGYSYNGDIANSYATSSAKGNNNVGGLVGAFSGSITTSYATGFVEGNNNVGGLVGTSYNGTITTSYATGSVKGGDNIGGLAGRNTQRITNSYATGNVEGNRIVGGLVGYNEYSSGTITNSYATGAVSGDSHAGGLVGYKREGTIRNSYWDKTTSRMLSSDGGVGKTTTELQSPIGATGIYSSWSNSSWDFGTREQYPALKYSAGTLMPNQGREIPEELSQIEIVGVPASAVGEGERITLTESSTSSASNIALIYQWTQTSGITLLTSPTSRSSVTLDVPEDYVVARANTSNVELTLRVSNDVGSNTRQVSITIAKSNNGGIAALGVPTLNERELTAPSIDISSDPDGGGNNIRYQWQIRQSTQTAWVDVQAAGTNERYTIPADITGIVQYRVVVSYTDGQGYEEEVVSATVIYERIIVPQPSIDIASLTSCGTADIDQDNDGLIEICDLEGLNAMRHQLDGSGYKVSASATKITAGCAESGCKGYELEKDLDFNNDDSYSSTSNRVIWTTGEGWQPIGNRSNSFSSTFKGNNHTISNLMINRESSLIGLFAMMNSSALIDGVDLYKVNIKGNDYVGALVGKNAGGTIRNSSVSGDNNTTSTVVGTQKKVGGLVGINGKNDNDNTKGKVINSFADVHVIGVIPDSDDNGSSVGGLIGINKGIISNSYAAGDVSGNEDIGGLVGRNEGGEITNSYATGTTTGTSSVGGLVSYSSGNITRSYWDKTTSGMSSSDGGVGKTTAELQLPIRPGSTSTEIYYGWSTNSWDFGTSVQYPALKYSDGTLMPNQRREPQIEIAGVPTGAVNEGESITMTASSASSASSIPLIYQWQQTSGKTLLINPTSGNTVILDVPEDYVAARTNIGDVVLTLRVSNDVDSNTHQVSITIAKRNNGGIAALGIPNLNERELTAPSIDSSGDPDGGGNNIGYQWQIRENTQTAWANVPAAGTNERYTIPADTTGIVQYRVVVSYTDGQGYAEQIESGTSSYKGNTIPSVEIAGVPVDAVDEGEQITLTAFPHNSDNNILPSYSWTQTLGKTLLISPTSGSRVTLDVPEDYVVASENTGNVVLMLEASNDVGSTAQQVLITIAKSNNGGIEALGIPNLNERELTAPSIDISGDPDGSGNNIRYQWQSRQSTQTAWVNVPAAGTNERYTIPVDTAGIVQYRVVVSYTDGQGYAEQVESGTSSYKGNTIPSVEIAGVPVGAVNEGEQITLTAFPHNSDNNILPSYSWTQTLGKTLLISPTSGSRVTLDVPEDYVVASDNTGNVVLMLEASNDVGSTAQQVLITIAKSNNGGIEALGIPNLNERELTAPSIDISGDPDGSGNNIRYQWQSRRVAKRASGMGQCADGRNKRAIYHSSGYCRSRSVSCCGELH